MNIHATFVILIFASSSLQGGLTNLQGSIKFHFGNANISARFYFNKMIDYLLFQDYLVNIYG